MTGTIENVGEYFPKLFELVCLRDLIPYCPSILDPSIVPWLVLVAKDRRSDSADVVKRAGEMRYSRLDDELEGIYRSM